MKPALIISVILCASLFQSARSQNSFWIQTNGPGTGYDVRSFTVDAHGVLFAGTWTDGSIWKTTDNGGSWTQCGRVPDPNPVVFMCTDRAGRIFASVFLKGIYRSTDDGASWQLKSSGLTDLSVRGALVDDSGYVWVATQGGLFRSSDSGESWISKRAGTYSFVYLDSAHAVVTEDGTSLCRSLTHGNSWTTVLPAGAGALGGVHADGSYFGSDGTSAIFRSTDFGAHWTDMHSGVSWSGYTDAFTFTPTGDVYYGRDGFSTGILVSRDTGKTWTVANDGLTTDRILPLFSNPDGFVFAGTNGQGVFRTRWPVAGKAAFLLVNPGSLDFGTVRIGARDTLSVQLSNGGTADTLRVDSIRSTSARFACSPSAILIPPRTTKILSVIYAPASASRDTGMLRISSNDQGTPLFLLTVTGGGFGLSHAPQIREIRLLPSNYGQARIVWGRSSDDSVGAADQATQYSIWRRVLTPGNQPVRSAAPDVIAPASTGAAWDFVQVVPAVALDEYAAVVPVPYVSSPVPPCYTFIVVVQTKGLQVYSSLPDSVQDPPPLTGITGGAGGEIPSEPVLQQNFPNPFNPSTTIRFGLPASTRVSLVVYNSLGQAVATLVNGEMDAGFHAVRFDGSNLSSGVYFCRLKAGEFVRTSRVLLLR